MAWLRNVVGVLLLLPSVGCTLCCSPFDNCGPLCNGECGSGCWTTYRAGGYAGQVSYYDGVSAGPRLAPTPAQPRMAPPQEYDEPAPEDYSPSDTMPDQPFDTYEPPDAGLPDVTDTMPEATMPDDFPDLPESTLPPFDEAFPQQPTDDDTFPDDSGIPVE